MFIIFFPSFIEKGNENLGYGKGHNFNFFNEETSIETWYIALILPDIYFFGVNLIGF